MQINALLQQCIITSFRYLLKKDVPKHSDVVAPDLSDRRVFITDKAFLYEYDTLTLPKLSERLGLCTRQTERFLQQNYKKCFSEKLLEAKMSAAIILLNRKNLSLFDVAEKVGYSSVEYFSNRFKKYYHISPRKYRQRQHSQNQQDSRVATKKLEDK